MVCERGVRSKPTGLPVDGTVTEAQFVTDFLAGKMTQVGP